MKWKHTKYEGKRLGLKSDRQEVSTAGRDKEKEQREKEQTQPDWLAARTRRK